MTEKQNEADRLRALLHKVAQILGAKDPMDVEDAARKTVAQVKQLVEDVDLAHNESEMYSRRLEEVQRSRSAENARTASALLRELNDLFEWGDESMLHALAHVRNAVLNLRADLRAERFLRENADGLAVWRVKEERTAIVEYICERARDLRLVERGIPDLSMAERSRLLTIADRIERGEHLLEVEPEE